MFEFTTLVLFALLIIIAYLIYKEKAHTNMPPGPLAWPIIGSLPYMSKFNGRFSKMCADLTKHYGGIATVYMGVRRSVMISDPDLLKEVYVKNADATMDKMHFKLFDAYHSGIGAPNGEQFKKNRRFIISALRDYGMGKRSLEGKITEEGSELVKAFATMKQPFCTKDLINNAVANVICHVLFGKRYDYGDEQLHRIQHLLDESFASGWVDTTDFFPFLKPLYNIFRPKTVSERVVAQLDEYIGGIVEDCRQTADLEDPACIVDEFLSREKSGTLSNNDVSLKVFRAIIRDAFSAGLETTANLLHWCLLYMVTYPEVQKRCRKEIEEVIGSGRVPKYDDRLDMHYTLATIYEVHRISQLVVMIGARVATRDIRAGGYDIPAGTCIYADLVSSITNNKYWKDADKFQPENWLDSEGKFTKKETKDSYYVFGVGPRFCVGEQLARQETFILLVMLLGRFEFQKVDDGREYRMDAAVEGITVQCHKFELYAK